MALAQQLQKKIYPMVVLIGQDNYLLEHSFGCIKTFIRKSQEVDEKKITIQTANDWQTMFEEANCYSLFAEMVLINALYDKKTLALAEKNKFLNYLNAVNPRCTIILRAPNLPAKLLQSVSAHEGVLVVLNQPLDSEAMKKWIAAQFHQQSLTFEPQVPALIHQYTQGNMLACAQWLEKLALSQDPSHRITTQQTLEHAFNQCDHAPFELIDACLMGLADKALQILRQASLNKTEAPLILWMMTQELRILLQLMALQQQMDFKSACNQLKIWSQRMSLYQSSLKRHQLAGLTKLLQYCQIIDERIKSNLNTQVWNALENLAIGLSLGQFMGEIQGYFS